MVDLRSEKKDVNNERRENERLEFHCEATVMGIKGVLTITDISLGGFFIEATVPENIGVGKLVSITANLPSEKEAIRLKAKIVSQTNRGIGCQFVELNDQVRDAICMCFELFRDTLPVGCK
jgi:hypothetical protein